MTWFCARCGEPHDELPAVAFQAPDAWDCATEDERKADFDLSPDVCVQRNEYFYVRCSLKLPIIGTSETFDFGIWSTLSETSFDDYMDYFGWLANQPPGYPDVTGVKCNVHPSEPDFRPLLELEDGGHPLCRHFHDGMTREFAAEYVHEHLGI
jgi:hypothetical protein